jgi:ribosomal protein L11 methyltransferase
MTTVWKVSVITGEAGESAVGDCLARVFMEPVSSYTDLELGEVQVSVYRRSRPGRELLYRLEHDLECLPEVNGAIASRVEVRMLKPRDWVNAWKRHFKAMTIGGCLLIKPSWSRKRPASAQRTVVLDPGLSFGTGQHPTTRFCLERIAAHRPVRGVKSLFDVGTGSGILAIAARKLRYDPVDAIDHDPAAVRIALANARRNKVDVRIRSGDATRLRTKRQYQYDVVCANLTSDLLLKHAGRLTAQVRPGGCLILAGILRIEFDRVRAAYESGGWRMTRSRVVREWHSGAFVAI